MKQARYFNQMLKHLQQVTKDCRENMHEPDEQNLTVLIRGHIFDNSMGSHPDKNQGEITIGFVDDTVPPYLQDEKAEWFNLANLIALARKANIIENPGHFPTGYTPGSGLDPSRLPSTDGKLKL